MAEKLKAHSLGMELGWQLRGHVSMVYKCVCKVTKRKKLTLGVVGVLVGAGVRGFVGLFVGAGVGGFEGAGVGCITQKQQS